MSELGELLDLLKSKGVKQFRGTPGSVIEVEFFPPVVEFQPAKAIDLESADDLCNCSHPMHHHVNGLCIHGCNEECSEEAK